MYTHNKLFLFLLITLCALVCAPREAAAVPNSFTVTMTTTTPDVTMGDPAGTTLTYSITNGNGNGSITQLQFTAPAGFTWQGCGALPSGWTCGAGGAVSLTISAGTVIAPGSTLTPVPLILNAIPSLGGNNLSGSLASVRATFSKGLSPISITPANTFPRVHSLLMTLVPSSYNVGAGCYFTLTMTVTNKSTSAITGVTSVPKPPTVTGVGATATTTSNPANLNLAASGGAGTMVWTYTAGATAGTLTFTAYARDTATTHTSSSVTTASITVSTGISCNFTVTIAVTPDCLYSGSMATFTMTVTNNTGGTINTVTPSALTKYVTGAANIGAFTGPSPASIASLANGASGTFTWTATVTGNINDTYYVTGYATSASPAYTTATATSNTEDIDGYIVTVNPAATYAGSTNEELVWTIRNYGCNTISNVLITVPAGWTASTDGYALVTNTIGNQIDTWTLSGTTFTSDSSTNNVQQGSTVNNFYLRFSATPSVIVATNYTFNITVTDATSPTPIVTVIPTTVTVNPFNTSIPGQGNYTKQETWRESY